MTKQITELTSKQQAQVAAYRDRYFAQATSTKPTDGVLAEATALQLADIIGIRVEEMRWVVSPDAGQTAVNRMRKDFRAALSGMAQKTLSEALHVSISDALQDTIPNEVQAAVSGTVRDAWDSFWAPQWDSQWEALLDASLNALQSSISGMAQASLSDEFRGALSAALTDSLWDARWDTLREPLIGAQWDALCGTRWLAFHSFVQEVLGVAYDAHSKRVLRLYHEAASSCFAIWIVPGGVVLCERPTSVTIESDRLVGLTWRKH